MSKTWLLRGGVAVVLAVLVGAWTMGVAGIGDKASTKEKISIPAPSEDQVVSEPQPSSVVETTSPQGVPPTPPSAEATSSAATTDDESSPDAVDDATSEAPRAKKTRSPKPEPKPSAPSPPKPSKSTTPTPSQPANNCNGVVELLNCVLAPITTKP